MFIVNAKNSIGARLGQKGEELRWKIKVTISKTKFLSFYKSLVAMPNSENNQICTSYIYTFLRQAFPWQESRCHWPELCASLCKFEAKLFAVI